MARALVSDELWAEIEPLLPEHEVSGLGGRLRVPDRAALTGILFVLKTGIQWEDLPQEMGCSSGMTCWRRLREWQATGVWDRLHQHFLKRLHKAGHLSCWFNVLQAILTRKIWQLRQAQQGTNNQTS